jgi:allantoin racemase
MTGTIFVINPNSSETVTANIDEAMKPLRASDGPEIACVTLAEGPPAVESQRDVDSVPGPLLRMAARLENAAAAFVVACFSDPGMHSLREQSRQPVLGIAESGVLTALTLGQRFGVIAILPNSIPRHLRYFGAMGVMSRFAGDLPAGLRVHELADPGRTLDRMTEVGQTLRDEHGADVLVMGCAGMAPYREPLEKALGIPVVEPTQAAVTMAIGRVRLGWNGRAGEKAAATANSGTAAVKAVMPSA